MSLGFDSRWTAPAGTWTKSPATASTTSSPPGPDSIRSRPETTYIDVSYPPWWCQPEVMPGAVLASPAQRPATAMACSRTMPGVESVSTRPSGVIRDTGSFAATAEHCTAGPPPDQWGFGRCSPMLPVQER